MQNCGKQFKAEDTRIQQDFCTLFHIHALFRNFKKKQKNNPVTS